jgi:hypothetical protein
VLLFLPFVLLHNWALPYQNWVFPQNRPAPNKEAAFKASKKKKTQNKKNSKLDCSCNDDSKEYEEVENFVRKLKT